MAYVVTATQEDIPAWLVLAAEVESLFGPLVNDPTFIRALHKNIARGTAFCVRKDGGPPGSKLLGGLLFSPRPPIYTISWLAVAQSSRRQGIGRLLVSHVIDLVKRPGIITVTTFEAGLLEGEPARHFYEQFGFVAAETSTDFNTGNPRQIFRRFLI